MSKIIILTGAGLSAPSKIPTFHDENDTWNNHNIKEVCSDTSLKENETKTINFYDERRADLKNKTPNVAHYVLSHLKNKYPEDISLFTQNIDDLFEKTKLHSDNITKLHGNLREVRCQDPQCNSIFDIAYRPQNLTNSGTPLSYLSRIIKPTVAGSCPFCKSKLRPNVVFMKEPVPAYTKFNLEIQDCKLLIVIGTSGKIMPLNIPLSSVPFSILNNLEKSPHIDEKNPTKIFYGNVTSEIFKIALEVEYFIANNKLT